MQNQSAVHTLSRSIIAFVWAWHGLVPKLIMHHPDESVPLLGMGLDAATADTIVTVSGWGEIAFALVFLFLPRAVWPLYLTIIGMSGLLIGVFVTAPDLALGAFNPVTLNILVIAMAVIAIRTAPSGNSNAHQ